MSSVREVGEVRQLETVRRQWQRLLDETEGASFFQSLEWLEVYWQHFGASQKLRVLLVESGGSVTGILPLVVRSERRRVGRIRVLTYPLDDWAPFFGPIGPDPAGTLAAGLDHIRSSRRDWDMIELRWVRGDSPLAQATREALQEARLQSYESVRDHTASVLCRGTWEQYFGGRSSKFRNNHRRQQNQMRRQGRIEFQRFRPDGVSRGDSDPRWDLYEVCEWIAGRSWQASSTTGTTLTHAGFRDFFRAAHVAAASAGAVDLCLLWLDRKPLAYVYNYHWHGYVFGLRNGFDASASRLGAGSLLLTLAIEDSFQRGDHTYDLGPGSADSKRRLATDFIPILQYTHYHPAAPRAQVLRLKHFAPVFWPLASAPAEPVA